MQLQVQIFNERQSEILATVNTSPTFRMTPPDKTTIVFYEAPVGQPEPIKAWLYPGDQYGREFIYGKSEAEMIAKAARDVSTPVYAKFTPQTPTNVTNAVAVPETRPEVVSPEVAAPPVVAQPEPTASVPQQEAAPTVVTAQPTPETAPVPAATTLPETGSSMPMFAMVALLSLAGALAVRVRNGSRSLF